MTALTFRVGSVAVLAAAAASSAVAAGAVTPSGDTVPENLLRIELHLTRPLRHALAMDHVRLVDEGGDPIADAFLDLPLPGDDGRTITLLLHPGRVKSGVGANLAMGRALRAGHEVELVVDDPQLPSPMYKHWHVSQEREESLSPPDWQLTLPAVGSLMPLRVRLGSPLTWSATALIAVRNPDGERSAGVTSLRDGETIWEFRPAKPWRTGHYGLVVHPRLEDVAGNRPCTPFETVGLSALPCAIEERGFDLTR